MKTIWKSVLIGLAVVLTEWIFVALFGTIFNGLSQAESVVIGTGFFLAFELVVCTGVIISKIEKIKKDSDEK